MKELEAIYRTLGIGEAVYSYGEATLSGLAERFAAIDAVAEYNQQKVLSAMQKNRVNATHFAATTGYGYDDVGREKIENIFAKVFGAEKAYVRWQISTGSQAISAMLYGALRPGDIMLSVTGRPFSSLTIQSSG